MQKSARRLKFWEARVNRAFPVPYYHDTKNNAAGRTALYQPRKGAHQKDGREQSRGGEAGAVALRAFQNSAPSK